MTLYGRFSKRTSPDAASITTQEGESHRGGGRVLGAARLRESRSQGKTSQNNHCKRLSAMGKSALRAGSCSCGVPPSVSFIEFRLNCTLINLLPTNSHEVGRGYKICGCAPCYHKICGCVPCCPQSAEVGRGTHKTQAACHRGGNEHAADPRARYNTPKTQRTYGTSESGPHPVLCSGVAFRVNILQAIFCDMGVDLGCGYVGMAQHLLNGPQVGAVFQ